MGTSLARLKQTIKLWLTVLDKNIEKNYPCLGNKKGETNHLAVKWYNLRHRRS